MAATLPNVWHLRKVADSAARACFICFKPTTRVLITPDNKDHFYVCLGHLSDRGFASPIIDAEAEAAKKREEAKKREIEKIVQEFEERQRKKKAKKKAKDDSKDKDGDKDKKAEGDEKADDENAEKERDEKIKSIESGSTDTNPEDIPRVYELHRSIYQMRVDRIRNVELAKKNQQRLQNPSFFPSTPKGNPL